MKGSPVRRLDGPKSNSSWGIFNVVLPNLDERRSDTVDKRLDKKKKKNVVCLGAGSRGNALRSVR